MEFLDSLTLNSDYSEVEKIEGLLNQLQQRLGFNDNEYARLMLTVSEAATNGIVHGNKLDKDKTISIEAFQDNGTLLMVITDEGEGFNPEALPDPRKEENLLKPSGRGVFLMKEYADQVEYKQNGTQLILSFSLPADNGNN